MAFPTITLPTVEFLVPTLHRRATLRVMTGHEEKLLLAAKEGDTVGDAYRAVKRVVEACATDPALVGRMAAVDLQYAFIRLRMASVSEKTKIVIPDGDAGIEVEVDLSEVEVVMPEADRGVLDVGDGLRVKLRYPPASLYDATDDGADFDSLLAACLDKVYWRDAVTDADTEAAADRLAFVQRWPIAARDRAREFLADAPTLRHVVKYQTAAGEQRELVLSRLTDFFQF